MGDTNPNARILLASARSCRSLCRRGFRGSGLSADISTSIRWSCGFSVPAATNPSPYICFDLPTCCHGRILHDGPGLCHYANKSKKKVTNWMPLVIELAELSRANVRHLPESGLAADQGRLHKGLSRFSRLAKSALYWARAWSL